MSRWRLVSGIGFVLLGAAILGVSAYVLTHRTEANASVGASTFDRTFFTEAATAMASHVNSDSTTITTAKDFALWWVDVQGHSISNDAAPAVEFRSAQCESDVPTKTRLRSLVRQFVPQIDGVMLAQGFTRNVRNSSRNLADDRFYDYVRAYERGDTKAVFSVSPDCWSRTGIDAMYYSFTFAYTRDFAANRRAQLPFLRDLSLPSDVVIHVSKRHGPWAVIPVNYRRTGYYIIAKSISGRWMKIFAGQDMPSCELVHTWAIPAAITPCSAASA